VWDGEDLAAPQLGVRFTITMEDRIEIHFDKRINGYVVTMPGFVTLDMIEEWKYRFDQELKTKRNSDNFALLFDTNKHNFESIQCLKSLREYLADNTVLKSRFSRVALVAPARFMAPIIKSEAEAYFDNFEQAYKWLKE
jgi:hypothetical protein